MLEILAAQAGQIEPRLVGQYTARASMPVSLYHHTAVEYQGNIYIFGGRSSIDGGPLSSLYRYNVALNTWTALASAGQTRAGHGAVVWNDYLYIFGGTSNGGAAPNLNDQLMRYSFAANSWELLASPLTGWARLHPQYVLLPNGQLWVGGGLNKSTQMVTNSSAFRIALSSVTSLGTPTPSHLRYNGFTTIYDDKIYHFGGNDKIAINPIPATYLRAPYPTGGQYTNVSISLSFNEAAFVRLGSCIYISAGLMSPFTWNQYLYEFDLDTETLTRVGGLSPGPLYRRGAAAAICNNAMYVFGGYDNSNVLRNTCHRIT